MILYGGIRLYKDGQKKGKEKCTDDVLQVSYSTNGSEQIIQKMITCGRSPQGLAGHVASLLHDADGTMRGNESKHSRSPTSMIVVGGTNPEYPSSSATADVLNVWMLDLVSWCWSKPTMPSSAINAKCEQLNWKYMVKRVANEIYAMRLSLENEITFKGKLSKSKQIKLDLARRISSIKACTIEKGKGGSLLFGSYPELQELLQACNDMGHKIGRRGGTTTSEDSTSIVAHLPRGDASTWDRKELHQFRQKMMDVSGVKRKEHMSEHDITSRSGVLPKNRYRGSMCRLPHGHGLLIFGGRGGGDGDAWWLWNLNWQTTFYQHAAGGAFI